VQNDFYAQPGYAPPGYAIITGVKNVFLMLKNILGEKIKTDATGSKYLQMHVHLLFQKELICRYQNFRLFIHLFAAEGPISIACQISHFLM